MSPENIERLAQILDAHAQVAKGAAVATVAKTLPADLAAVLVSTSVATAQQAQPAQDAQPAQSVDAQVGDT